MINEKVECGQYFKIWTSEKSEYDNYFSQYCIEDKEKNKLRFSSTYYKKYPTRVIKMIARHYWYDNNEIKKLAKNDKINKIKEKLKKFHDEVIISAYSDNNNLDEYKRKGEKYSKDKLEPYIAKYDNDFTFYSIIADAVNEGELVGSAECELSVKEIKCVLEATSVEGRGKALPCAILALICYHKVFKNSRKLPDNYIPIDSPGMQAWFQTKKAWEDSKKFINNKNKNGRFFIDIKRIHNINNRYKVDEYLIDKEWKRIVENENIDETGEMANKIYIINDKYGNIKQELEEIIKKYI